MSYSEPAPFASALIVDGALHHVHHARCELCMLGSHQRGDHGWAGPGDIAHAAETGQPDPTNQRCACWCFGTPELGPEPPDLLDDGELTDAPCVLCGEAGACGYDAEGRPMIHATWTDADEDEQP